MTTRRQHSSLKSWNIEE
jgi:hypothetical protein